MSSFSPSPHSNWNWIFLPEHSCCFSSFHRKTVQLTRSIAPLDWKTFLNFELSSQRCSESLNIRQFPGCFTTVFMCQKTYLDTCRLCWLRFRGGYKHSGELCRISSNFWIHMKWRKLWKQTKTFTRSFNFIVQDEFSHFLVFKLLSTTDWTFFPLPKLRVEEEESSYFTSLLSSVHPRSRHIWAVRWVVFLKVY